ncbi:MAG: phosphoglycolate phosphatase [Halobacteriales archaeon SW_9_67_25]|jgi:phosphoglycolate phosphatase (TIGR01487 family)|nr:MAG: phosphoglycolate phosphatase [Halobacteriales archaeon SW_9_67_25]
MDDPGSLVPETGPPLVVDVDGTLTDADRRLDPRVFPVLRAWPAPVVVATGKALPFPVALCDFVGIDVLVIAENGGVVVSGPTDRLHVAGDRAAASAVASAYRERGYDLGWGEIDLANRWRETEIIVRRDAPLDPLSELAAEHDLEVVDTGFAYHVKSIDFDKGTGLEFLAGELDRPPGRFAAVGDSVNDVPVFARAGRAVAVANADDDAREEADHVTDASYVDGFLKAVEWFAGGSPG